MPIVTIQVTREGTTPGVVSVNVEQKVALIKGASQLLLDVLNKPLEATFVIIEEVEMDNGAGVAYPLPNIGRSSQKRSVLSASPASMHPECGLPARRWMAMLYASFLDMNARSGLPSLSLAEPMASSSLPFERGEIGPDLFGARMRLEKLTPAGTKSALPPEALWLIASVTCLIVLIGAMSWAMSWPMFAL